MRIWLMALYVFLFFATGCIDRVFFEMAKPVNYGIVISGFISDQPGPYEVRVTTAFDIESKESVRKEVSVRKMVISDNIGNSETLTEVKPGIYQTNANGLRGVVGGIYTMKLELLDGAVFESYPDTILAPSSLDSLYVKFSDKYNELAAKEYFADIFFDASLNRTQNKKIMWRLNGTFKAMTHPEIPNGGCHYSEELVRCNFVPPCSGYRNVGTNAHPIFEKLFPCTCCTCWYDIHENVPMLSDELFSNSQQIKEVKISSIPLNEWTLWYRLRVEVAQRVLTRNSFAFFKAIRDQKEATDNLFQPISGRIPSHFTQLEGTQTLISGIFFATSVSSKVIHIQRFGTPPAILLPSNLTFAITLDEPVWAGDCRLRFGNSTNTMPSFWED